MAKKPLRPLTEQSGRGKQLSERVANRVREAIIVGDLRSPDYIRTEHLAADLGVSPTPVREALMVLSAEGSVKWEPRRGFRVVPVTARDIRDLFDVQAYVAGELATRACERLTDDDIAKLEAIQAELDAAAERDDAGEVDRLNHQFHRLINRTADSVRLANLLRYTVQHVPLSEFDAVTGWAEASVHDHRPILECLRTGDADGVRAAMETHIRHVGDQLVDHLRKQINLP